MGERRALLTVALATVLFGAAIAARHIVNPWWTNTGAAIIATVAAAATLRGQLSGLFGFQLGPALIAVALGALMVGATHLGFRAAVELYPSLGHDVSRLYRDITDTTPGIVITIPLVCFIVAAEEIVWRGVAIEWCQTRLSPAATAATAVALYALPQLIGGSWILIAAALVVGVVFTVQRMMTNRITEPLISHAIWSLSVFTLVPLV